MRTVHRIVSLFVVIVALYLGVTGTLVQIVDLKTLYSHAPATDLNMIAIREDKDGPGNYQVLDTPDYAALPLPAAMDYQSAFSRLLEVARSTLGDSAVDYAEVRMGPGGPTGVVVADQKLLEFGFASGQTQIHPEPHNQRIPVSTRNTFKHLHRMTPFGDWALWINPVVGVAFGVFIVTGVVMYWRLLSARKRIKRTQWFWVAGGWWRSVHRWISIVATLFIAVIAVSGTWLAIESLVFGYYLSAHMPHPGQPMPAARPTGVTPLPMDKVGEMISATLKEYESSLSDQPLKVMRLRVFGGMRQGVVVVGSGDDTKQVVFNTVTGMRAGLTEPGYPDTGFPFGWNAHQIAKQVHRGSYFGMTGRWMDFFGGISIVYLSISGIVMYVDMWNRRRRAGRGALIWT